MGGRGADNGDGFDVWAYDVENRHAYALTSKAGGNFGASFSADGSKMVFVSNRGGRFCIYEMDKDGANQRSLGIVTVLDGSPHYSPDGQYILFSKAFGESNFVDMFRYEIATREIVNITH